MLTKEQCRIYEGVAADAKVEFCDSDVIINGVAIYRHEIELFYAAKEGNISEYKRLWQELFDY